MPPKPTPESRKALEALLKPDKVKLCFTGWAPGVEEVCCTFCGKMYKTCRNTTNTKMHLLSKHSDVIVAFLAGDREMLKELPPGKSTDSETASTQESAKEGNTAPPNKIRRLQPTLKELIQSASSSQKDESGQKSLLALCRLLVKSGVCISNLTCTDLDSLKDISPRFRTTGPQQIIQAVAEKAEALRPLVLDTLRNTSWIIDVQVTQVSAEQHMSAIFAIYYDASFRPHSPCIAAFYLDSSMSPDVIAIQVKMELQKLGIPLNSVKAALSFCDITNEAIQKCFTQIPFIECTCAKLQQLVDLLWKNKEVKEMLRKMRNFFKHLSSPEMTDKVKNVCETIEEVTLSDILCSSAEMNDDLCVVKLACSKVQAYKSILLDLDIEEEYQVTFTALTFCNEIRQMLTVIELSCNTASEKEVFLVSEGCTYMHVTYKKLAALKLSTSAGKVVRSELTQKLSDWIGKRLQQEPTSSALLLDPRSKATLHLKDPLIYSQVLKKIKDELKALVREQETNEEICNETDDSDEAEGGFDALLSSFEVNDFVEKRSGVTKIDVALSNLDVFLKDLEIAPSSTDVGLFWKRRLSAEPFLAQLALKKLGFPGRRIVSWSKFSQSKSFCKQPISDITNAVLIGSLSSQFWCSNT